MRLQPHEITGDQDRATPAKIKFAGDCPASPPRPCRQPRPPHPCRQPRPPRPSRSPHHLTTVPTSANAWPARRAPPRGRAGLGESKCFVALRSALRPELRDTHSGPGSGTTLYARLTPWTLQTACHAPFACELAECAACAVAHERRRVSVARRERRVPTRIAQCDLHCVVVHLFVVAHLFVCARQLWCWEACAVRSCWTCVLSMFA